MTGQERIMRIVEIEQELQNLPKGRVFYKTIKGKTQPYLQWSEKGKTVTKYVKVNEREKVFRDLERRNQLTEEMEALKAEQETNPDSFEDLVFRMNVVVGAGLDDQINAVRKFQKRKS